MCSSEVVTVPREVVEASNIDWGVIVDAYLANAARVGGQYAALVYRDRSGVSSDGMTVLTPVVRPTAQKGTFTLIQTLGGGDHHVIASRYGGDE